MTTTQKEVYFIRIPHQSSVTIGQCIDNRDANLAKAEYSPEDNDDWAFWNDSHATYTFDTKMELLRWVARYTGHQWMQVRNKVRAYIINW